jgi:hypothetical protein
MLEKKKKGNADGGSSLKPTQVIYKWHAGKKTSFRRNKKHETTYKFT